MSDPRDAALAAAWATCLGEKRKRWPWWGLPRERPHGRRAGLWLIHLASIALGGAIACKVAFDVLPGFWPWLVVAGVAYTVVTTPFTIRRMLHSYWNAASAAEANQALSTGFPHERSTGERR